MASRTIITWICDLEHQADTTAVETVSWSAGGAAQELDVCLEHQRQFASALLPFSGAARAGTGRRPANVRAKRMAARERLRAEGNPELADRGRVPLYLQEKFNAYAAVS